MAHYLLTDFVNSGSPPMRKIMEDLCEIAHKCAQKIGLDKNAVKVNALYLALALERYTRDIFGCKRIVDFIETRFEDLSTSDPESKNKIEKLKKDMREELEKSGLRISSNDPKLHKKCAFLLYNLTFFRPFCITAELNDVPEREKKTYFNACVSVYITNLVLATVGNPKLAPRGYEFSPNPDLIRNLTLRTLTRSGIEEMMQYAIRPKP